MRFSCFILVAVVYLNISASAQNEVLMLKKKNTGKEKVIHEGKRIKVRTVTGLTVKGRLGITAGDSIALNQDTMALSQIERIRTKSAGSLAVGSVVTGAGALMTTGGAVIFAQSLSQNVMILIIYGFIIGGAMMTYGTILTASGILILTIGKKYHSSKWDFQIRHLAKVPG